MSAGIDQSGPSVRKDSGDTWDGMLEISCRVAIEGDQIDQPRSRGQSDSKPVKSGSVWVLSVVVGRQLLKEDGSERRDSAAGGKIAVEKPDMEAGISARKELARGRNEGAAIKNVDTAIGNVRELIPGGIDGEVDQKKSSWASGGFGPAASLFPSGKLTPPEVCGWIPSLLTTAAEGEVVSSDEADVAGVAVGGQNGATQGESALAPVLKQQRDLPALWVKGPLQIGWQPMEHLVG